MADETPPRFSWPMRIFLTLAVSFLIFRSLTDLSVTDPEATEASCATTGLSHYPARLPTASELRASSTPSLRRSLRSVARYLNPYPDSVARARIDSAGAAARYAWCYLLLRSDFVENVAGINQEWRMFEDIYTSFDFTRARLEYSDGSQRIVRQTMDPEDRTFYSHWFVDKRGNIEIACDKQEPLSCLGYCNYLAHSHPGSKDAPLVRIILFPVHYEAPPPGVDARAFLAQQNGAQKDLIGKPFFEYDVASGRGRVLD